MTRLTTVTLINDKRLPQCPPCPAEPWVVLAQMTLPASSATEVTASSIDNIAVRRQLYSTAVLQEQLIACCCKEHPQQVPAKVIGVEPPNGAIFDVNDTSPTQPPPEFIEISFDKPLRGDTVKGSSIQVVRSERDGPPEPWPGIVTYNVQAQSARFTPDSEHPLDAPPNEMRLYTLTVVGDGSDQILDVDGLALDGTGDGSPGGNFTSTFTVDRLVG